METVVDEEGENHQTGYHAEEVTTFPFLNWNEGLEALNCAAVVKETRENPETDSKHGHEHICNPTNCYQDAYSDQEP